MRDINDLRAGHAVSGFSVTNHEWVTRGADVPEITRNEAGRILVRLARENDFTAFEYAMTDIAGHKGDAEWMIEILEEVDAMLAGVLEERDDQLTVIVTSDHGNIEDLQANAHTRNPALTMVFGRGANEIAEKISSLTDITPTIVNWLIADSG